MTPEERAEAIVTSEDGIDSVSHCDTFRLEKMIAAAIREAVVAERGRCEEIARGSAPAGNLVGEWAKGAKFLSDHIARRIRDGDD